MAVCCVLATLAIAPAASATTGAGSGGGRIAFSTGFVSPYEDRDVGAQVYTVQPGRLAAQAADACSRRA